MANALDPLIPHVGYYNLAGEGFGDGAFLALGVIEFYGSGTLQNIIMSVAMSEDGKRSSVFDNLELTKSSDNRSSVTAKAASGETIAIDFERIASDGKVGSCTGKAVTGGKETVFTGTSAFNQAPLQIFTGDYYRAEDKSRPVMTIHEQAGAITVTYDFAKDGNLSEIAMFTYVPDMFVLSFAAPTSGNVTVMLGTSGPAGLVAGITGPDGKLFYAGCASAQPE